MKGYWTCQRVENKLPCKHVNPNRKRKCGWCGKPRAARRRPAHLAALKEPYSVFLALNGGIERCGICGAEPGARKLHRDHDHRTGAARGLLCFKCNSALRPYMTREWLQSALDYVERTLPEPGEPIHCGGCEGLTIVHICDPAPRMLGNGSCSSCGRDCFLPGGSGGCFCV